MCKLITSLYGLKHVLKQWYYKFDNVIKLIDFMSCDVDKYLLLKKLWRFIYEIGFTYG